MDNHDNGVKKGVGQDQQQQPLPLSFVHKGMKLRKVPDDWKQEKGKGKGKYEAVISRDLFRLG